MHAYDQRGSDDQILRDFICHAKELGLCFLGSRVWGIRNA